MMKHEKFVKLRKKKSACERPGISFVSLRNEYFEKRGRPQKG
ncbi:MAG: hypothetical protein AB8G05_01055 [Oligoflexales bacterium]